MYLVRKHFHGCGGFSNIRFHEKINEEAAFFIMQFEVGNIVEGKITGITKFGAFVDLGSGKTGMVHISEVAPTYVKEIRDYLAENQMVKVKILSIGEDGKISLSIKKAAERPAPSPAPRRPSAQRPDTFEWRPNRRSENLSFEDMLNNFKKSSDEKMSDIKRGFESKRGSSPIKLSSAR